jgi:DNA-binding response OmpR family regulator
MSNARILVVDDEADIRDLVQEILSEEGYVVDVAANAAEARAACARQPPDLVLLDIWMPDIDGISLLREWQQSQSLSVPVTRRTRLRREAAVTRQAAADGDDGARGRRSSPQVGAQPAAAAACSGRAQPPDARPA